MEWEGREESSNVDDRRSLGGQVGVIGGVGGVVLLLVGLFLGVDPRQLGQLVGPRAGPAAHRPVDPQEERQARFTKVVFHDTELVWDEQFKQMNREYRKPTLVLFSGQVDSACGTADAAVGPFYCPGDGNVYIDLSFYHDMEGKLNAPGDFARAYVVAHEVGHHVQRLLGYPRRGGRQDEPQGRQSVRLELQADFLAGVWAHHAQEKFRYLQQGDVEGALKAAFEIGDDRLQKRAQGRVVPDSFTHGTSAQRMRWFKDGFKTGDVRRAQLLFTLPYEEL